MSKSLMKLLSVSLLTLSLTACGGAGETKITTENKITIKPSYKQTEVNKNLVDLTGKEGFFSAQSFMAFDVDDDGTVSNVSLTQFIGGPNTVYDPSDQSFKVQARGTYQEFSVVGSVHPNVSFPPPPAPDIDVEFTVGPDEVDQAASNETFRVYQGVSENGQAVNFTMLIPGDPVHNYEYVSLGVWDTVNEGDRAVAYGSLVFGLDTFTYEMPETGSAEYNGFTLGYLTADNQNYSLKGDATLTANFSNSVINGAFSNMTKTNLNTNVVSLWRDFTSTSEIHNYYFIGSAETNDGVLGGSLDGVFYGPRNSPPVEIGGSWHLGTGTGETAIGAFVAKKQ